MDKEKIKVLARVSADEIAKEIKDDRALIFIAVYIAEIIGITVALPGFVAKYVPATLRILANAMDVITQEATKDAKKEE